MQGLKFFAEFALSPLESFKTSGYRVWQRIGDFHTPTPPVHAPTRGARHRLPVTLASLSRLSKQTLPVQVFFLLIQGPLLSHLGSFCWDTQIINEKAE